VEEFLEYPELWLAGDYPQARVFMEDLKAYLVQNWPCTMNAGTPGGGSFPGWIRSVNSGNTLTFSGNTSQFEAGFWYQPTPAVDNETELQFYAPAGDYELKMLVVGTLDAGIVWVYLDDVLQGQLDQYRSSLTLNIIQSNPLTILTDGLHTLRLKMATKNVSSSNYYFRLTDLKVYRL
jgi:hypothetical protein